MSYSNSLGSYHYFFLFTFGCIDSGGQSGAFLQTFIVLTAVLPVIPPSSCKELRVVKTGQSSPWFRVLSLRFFWSWVFYWLGLTFGFRDVQQLVALKAVLINILAGGGLYLSLGLDFDCFFSQGILSIQVPIFLVDL